jgi:chromosome segregation protein
LLFAADEARLDEIGRDLRAKEKAHDDCREERVRREAAFSQSERDLAAVIERVRAALECRPEDILGEVGIDADAELPEAAEAQTKLERLLRERETMGPVNLRAEAEATELGSRIETMQTERADLTAAIAKLRHGISNLNREGRQRLLAAFTEIDRHFQELFKRLFGGGRAHLALTEAEDPLEAGLEVMASPPGKKLQSMSLLTRSTRRSMTTTSIGSARSWPTSPRSRKRASWSSPTTGSPWRGWIACTG